MNKAILSGTVVDTKVVEGIPGKSLYFTLRINAMDSPNAGRENVTDIPCVVLNPRESIQSVVRKSKAIECSGRLIRSHGLPHRGKLQYSTRVVIDSHSIHMCPR